MAKVDLKVFCLWVCDILSSTEFFWLNRATATTSGILKDERNTPMRKERHRNGKMLRGGLGLTTGLGWSDRFVPLPLLFSFVELEFCQ